MIGVDVSDATIEVVELASRWGRPTLVAAGRTTLPSGVVKHGLILDESALRTALEEVCRAALPRPIRSRQACFGLPETQFYSQVLGLPSTDFADRRRARAAAVAAAARLFPLPAEEQVVAYKVLGEAGPDLISVLLVAVSRITLETWWRFFGRSGFHLAAAEPEPVALARGIFLGAPLAPVALLDLGSRVSQLSAFDKRGWLGAYLVPAPGDDQAKLLATLSAALEHLTNARQFKPEALVLAGGGSQRRGITQALGKNLSLPVRLALLPPIFSDDHNALRRFWLRGEAYYYLEAAGLALGGLGFGRKISEPVIHYRAHGI